MSCPVDHSSPVGGGCPVDHAQTKSQTAEKCPVDHSPSSSWSNIFSNNPHGQSHTHTSLSTSRETSSIPKVNGENWVYPSETQFFSAMARKNHNPQAPDMKVIVPIHNAVNERTWYEVLRWEEGRGGDKCGGVKLVSFKGKPKELSPRARWRSLLGYAPPFDRHDWIVDRCGQRTRYIIDFYTGRSLGSNNNPSFFLDVRPALDSWEGVKMRLEKFWSKWLGSRLPSSPSAAQSPDES